MTFSYDKLGDVLYISFEALPPDAYEVVENEAGDVLKLDRHTKRVVGCMIPSFTRRCLKGVIDIPEIGAVQFSRMAEELLHHS